MFDRSSGELGNGGVAGGVTGNPEADGDGDGGKEEGIDGRCRCVDEPGVFGEMGDLGTLPFDEDDAALE